MLFTWFASVEFRKPVPLSFGLHFKQYLNYHSQTYKQNVIASGATDECVQSGISETQTEGYIHKRKYSLRWRHNGCDSVSNHQPHDCLLNRLFRRRSKKTSKLRVTGLCAGNSPETGEFPAQMASDAENVSIWWRHHVKEPLALNNLFPFRLLIHSDICSWRQTRWSYYHILSLCLMFISKWTTFWWMNSPWLHKKIFS